MSRECPNPPAAGGRGGYSGGRGGRGGGAGGRACFKVRLLSLFLTLVSY